MGFKQYYARKGDIIEIRIKDSSYNTIYKAKVNISDSEKFASVLSYIEKAYGVKVPEAIEHYLDNFKNKWFDS